MPLRRVSIAIAALWASYIAAAALSNLLPHQARAFGSLALIALFSMIAAAFIRMPSLKMIASVFASTVLALIVIWCWRRLGDPTAALGPIPSSLELLAFAVLGVITVGSAAITSLVFPSTGRAHRVRWIVFGAMSASLITVCALASRWTDRASSPAALMQRVVMLEQSANLTNWGERQELSTALAILGCQREAREIPLGPDAVGSTLCEPPAAVDSPSSITALPWRDAITKIAAEHRLVLIMEAHTISEHRAWIDQTLPTFRTAGFTHYFAEAIAEPGSQLKARGFPTAKTGVYTFDPRFGNLIRTAIKLDFEIGGYDAFENDFNGREERQATNLAAQFAGRPNAKMVVHAGHGHIFKHEVRNVGRYMAARLWQKTGIEPFTIWQFSNELPNDVYRNLVRQVGPITEPVLLIPPPPQLAEALFPESTVQPAVDAIVVHPPSIGREPADRRGAFANGLTQIRSVWLGQEWPVVISAMTDGEPDTAIPLDQIMLRPGETEFELWISQPKYKLRAWSLKGPLKIDVDNRSTSLQIKTRP